MFRCCVVLLLAWPLFQLNAVGASSNSSQFASLDVATPDGLVRGFEQKGFRVWRGIPFAKPPLGDLRFRPLQRPDSWDGVLNATDFGPSCMQMGSPGVVGGYPAWTSLNLSTSSEDCMYANVYAPSFNVHSLPVMVYFHAGEFNYGSSNDQESKWPHFAAGKVIVVTANVRLGYLGFAALDALRDRDPAGSTGNYGMQDQREVLRWVQRSIASFGGDPAQVTIFGESSGGTSVGFHLASPLSHGLFFKGNLAIAWPYTVKAVAACRGKYAICCQCTYSSRIARVQMVIAQIHQVAVVSWPCHRRCRATCSCQLYP